MMNLQEIGRAARRGLFRQSIPTVIERAADLLGVKGFDPSESARPLSRGERRWLKDQRRMLGMRHLHPERKTPLVAEYIEMFMFRMRMIAMMDGGFYLDMRTPFTAADIGAVTLATTDKALHPVSNFPFLGANYFGFLGKQVRVRLFGRITTAATPGNGAFDIYWGTGADANGTIIGSSAALALTAAQTNLSWMVEFDVVCRAFGSAGALLATGFALFNNAVLANTLQPMLIPASAAAQVAVDLSAANIISTQFKRSGSTVETAQVHSMQVVALN